MPVNKISGDVDSNNVETMILDRSDCVIPHLLTILAARGRTLLGAETGVLTAGDEPVVVAVVGVDAGDELLFPVVGVVGAGSGARL